MGDRYQVKLDGQGFLMRPGSYKRVASALAPEPRTQNPELSSGWRWWHQSDWRGGEGQRVWDGERRWRAGYGVDISEAGRVRLGPALAGSFTSTEDGFAAMLAFGSKLYAAAGSSGRVYSFDGSTWEVAHDTLKTSLRSMARHGNDLYVGSGSDGLVKSFDGTSWVEALTVAGALAVPAMAGYGVWDPTAGATVPRLFLAAEYGSGEARIHRWDGSTLTQVAGCREAMVEAMAVYGGQLLVATSDTGNGVQGRILCFDGRSASGEWSEVAWLPDSYVAGWVPFDNLIFCGSGTGGRIWAFDGSRMVEACCISAPGLEYSQPLRALGVQAGRLYVGYNHPSQGTALLCKLGAGGVSDPETRGRGDPGMESCQLGWWTPATWGSGGNVSAMAVYGGHLQLASEATGAATIYRMDPDVHRNSGLLETSILDGGLPGVSKLLRSVTLSHDKLLPGQQLQVWFALDGSDTFQQVERFDDLASCDRPLTTADWRAADSLVRLKGMPAQGFAGKRRGDPGVAHVARGLASPNHNSPPATFVEEFDDAEYASISAVGGGVATTMGEAEGDYTHQLFELELAGLSIVGLRPRAVCYGQGDSFGMPAPGVLFRIWNHATGAWDLVGSNMAAPGDGVAARTIESTMSDFGCYLGTSGRVYLSLRSSHAGSVANPSRVGTDLVEMGALWAGDGEAVSRPLRLPATGTVSRATITLLSSLAPAGTGIELYMSADGGEHWEVVSGGIEHVFAHPGSSLRWKARLSAADGLDTPWIDGLKVDYLIGDWLWLGRSEVEGSTSAVFPFESDVAARRVAFRIELGSTDPSGSPSLAGIALQYAPRPEVKRRWELELMCEGVAGAPLRLPDGSQEGKTGRELSQILWQARARGIVSFQDVDGGQHQVWFQGLEERLSDAAQERGPQTVARCRLVED